MNNRNIRGAIPLIALVWVLIAGGSGYAGLKIWQAFSPNQHKKEVVAVDAQAQAVASQSADNEAKLAAALASDQSALAAEKKREQDAAGFVAGASIALAGENNPTVGVQVATKMVSDAAQTLDPATTAQNAQFAAMVADMKAKNAQLTAALQAKEAESVADKAAVSTAIAQAKVSDDAAKLSAAKLDDQAKAHAVEVGKLNDDTKADKTLIQRIESFGIGGSVLLLVVLPCLCLAFPQFLPVVKSATGWLLGLWHAVYARIIADLTAAHAAATTALAAETAAHSATKAALVVVASAPAVVPIPAKAT